MSLAPPSSRSSCVCVRHCLRTCVASSSSLISVVPSGTHASQKSMICVLPRGKREIHVAFDPYVFSGSLIYNSLCWTCREVFTSEMSSDDRYLSGFGTFRPLSSTKSYSPKITLRLLGSRSTWASPCLVSKQDMSCLISLLVRVAGRSTVVCALA